MENRIFQTIIALSMVTLLAGCDNVGKRMAKKSFQELESKVAEQQEAISQLSAQVESQLKEKPGSEPATIDKKSRNISSMFSRSSN